MSDLAYQLEVHQPASPASAAQRVVCVLGMHRSGTSVVASLLEGLGVHLGGADALLRPLPENPRGYWEHGALKDVNEALLAHLGGRWHSPPNLPDGWQRAAALDELRAQARVLLREQFGESVLWGWKDPRTCLTLPFWKPLLPEASYVICLRNPFDVARSLRARDDLPLEHGLRLWLAYTAAALAHSAGHPRLLLFYEDVLTDREETASALARFIGCRPLSRDAVAALVAPELRHHGTPMVATVGDPGCPYPVSSLYLILRSYLTRANGPDAQIHAILNAAAARALDAQAALDAARVGSGWRVTPMRPLDSIGGTRTATATSMPRTTTMTSNGSVARTRMSSAASALRGRGRNYLARHQDLAIAYRRVRRIVRRCLQLGP
jgi:hypothetical protein